MKKKCESKRLKDLKATGHPCGKFAEALDEIEERDKRIARLEGEFWWWVAMIACSWLVAAAVIGVVLYD